MENMTSIVKKFAQSPAYRRLESLLGLLEDKIYIPLLDEKIKTAYSNLRKEMSKVIERLSGHSLPDAKKMNFYRLVCKLPAYSKFKKFYVDV